MAISFHEGEIKVQSHLHVPLRDNPTSPGLAPYCVPLLHLSSMLVLGTLDDEGRPWTTLLAGQPGFARSLGGSIVGVKAVVDRKFDPVVQLLVNRRRDGNAGEMTGDQQTASALGIHLATRERVKLTGHMIRGALEEVPSLAEKNRESLAEMQLALSIQQSMGNCPKYINKKRLVPTTPRPVLSSTSLPLPDAAIELLAKADMFFITASNQGSSMSTNHRGGPPGFVRVARNDECGAVLVYPELSGNRLYQTLGNLYTTPKAGMIFPDFDSGDALYITGTTEILFGKNAAAVLPRSNLAVKISVDMARFVQQGLTFRGETGERSPYNPSVRYLPIERALPDAQSKDSRVVYAKLLARKEITPTIARFKFSVSDPEASGRWKPGQYVALAFEHELSVGYSHMRDDDPRSLNDDYIRTFTISSPPGGSLPHDEFEITIRKVGVVTGFLFRQNIRAEVEVPFKGFGGSFSIHQGSDGVVPFVAGGIGITPLLAQSSSLDFQRLKLFWTLNIHDVGLVFDTFDKCPMLAPSTELFLSNLNENTVPETSANVEKLKALGCQVASRRMLASDVEAHQSLSSTWYLCTGASLRRSLLAWLPGKTTVFEDFDY